MIRVLTIALALLAAVPAAAKLSDQRASVIVIDLDGGGNIGTYLTFYRRIEDAGIPVRVEGPCISACTLVLGLPRDEVCVTRTASFGFHLASSEGHTVPGLTSVLVQRYYPPKVQKWIKDNGPLTEDPIFLSGTDVIALGILRECDP